MPPHHGGNLSAAQQEFGLPPGGWVDLSTGINPIPYPEVDLDSGALTNLPQQHKLDELLAAAATAYDVSSSYSVAAGPGSQAILQILPALRARSRVAVLSPTYEEHTLTWRQLGHSVVEIESLESLGDADVLVVVNPNNPDGTIIGTSELTTISTHLASKDGWLIVDEAFADTVPEVGILSRPQLHNTITVRSFGKFFGLAGLRLGFAAGAPEVVDAVSERLGPWAVSGPALEIGIRALGDRDWINATKARLAASRKQLDQVLDLAKLNIIGGTDLFRLVDTPAAQSIYRQLGQAGILVRRFERHPNWLRFGLAGSDEILQQLADALAEASTDA